MPTSSLLSLYDVVVDYLCGRNNFQLYQFGLNDLLYTEYCKKSNYSP